MMTLTVMLMTTMMVIDFSAHPERHVRLENDKIAKNSKKRMMMKKRKMGSVRIFLKLMIKVLLFRSY